MLRKRKIKKPEGGYLVEVFIERAAVEIGSANTGKPEGFADTIHGVYWTVMVPPDSDERRIQRALAPSLGKKPFTP